MSNYEIHHNNNRSHISEVPEGWKLKRLKYLTKSKKELSETGEEELLSVTETRGIIKRKELKSDDEPLSRSDDLIGYRLVEEGNLVNNIMLVWKRGLGVSPYSGIVSPAYSVFSFSKECDPWYFNYLLRSEEYITEFRRNSTGITMSRLRLYDDSFGDVFGVLPPLNEQKIISRYLDKKTSQIDKLISKIKKRIELLKEQRTSLINQYVTKGLDPNVEMKDSGIEWIGEIPKHWEFRKLKHFFSYKKGVFGQQLTTTFLSDNAGEYPVYSGQTENFGILGKWDNHEFDFKNGVIFCTTVGAKLMTTRVISGKFSLSQNCLIMIPKNENINSEYINYFFDFDFKIRRELLPTILQPSLRMEDLDQYWIPVPPVSEQMNIINKLNSILNRSDQVTNNLVKKISLLKEYRQSLISSAVTGKVRIKGELV